jgi:hypothetical protein
MKISSGRGNWDAANTAAFDDTAVFFTSRSDAKEFLVKNRKLFNKLLGITTIKKTKKNKRDDDNEDDETDNKQQKVASPSS